MEAKEEEEAPPAHSKAPDSGRTWHLKGAGRPELLEDNAEEVKARGLGLEDGCTDGEGCPRQ